MRAGEAYGIGNHLGKENAPSRWAYRMALFGREIARVGDDESQCPLVARLDIQNLRGSLARFPAPGFRPTTGWNNGRRWEPNPFLTN